MDFQKKMKQRLWIAAFYILSGLTLVLADILRGLENDFFFAFGFALTAMGIFRLYRHRKITKSDQTMRKQKLAESDERTRMIAERARSWAFSLSVFVSGIAVIVLQFLDRHETALPFAWYVCGMVVLYWISFVIIQKKN